MTLKPEQQRAMSYLRRKGTEATPESLRQRVATALRAMEEEIEKIDADTARRPAEEGRWSIHEIVNHLIESHRPAVDQLEAILAGCGAGAAIPAGLQSADPMALTWDSAVAELKRVHADFLHVLARGTPETSLASRAPVAMVIKVQDGERPAQPVEWLEELDWKAYAVGISAHTREHQAQISRIRAMSDDHRGR